MIQKNLDSVFQNEIFVMDELISVIIPVYNSERTLKKCIESAISQTYKNLEIIIIESDSTDNSAYICDCFEKNYTRVKVIHQPEKRGLSNARNEGMKFANGEFLCFLDSDDWIANDIYEILHKAILETSSDIACGNVVRTISENVEDVTGQSFEIMKYSKQDYAKKFFRIKSNETVHYIWNKMYKRSVAKKIHFPEGLLAEDVEGFFLRIG